MVVKNIEKKINIEPILKRIIESDFPPSLKIVKIQTIENRYKVPLDIDETVLVKFIHDRLTKSSLISSHSAKRINWPVLRSSLAV